MLIDLNADLAEGFGDWRIGDDDALLDVISSANIACGFHAGDAAIMDRTLPYDDLTCAPVFVSVLLRREVL